METTRGGELTKTLHGGWGGGLRYNNIRNYNPFHHYSSKVLNVFNAIKYYGYLLEMYIIPMCFLIKKKKICVIDRDKKSGLNNKVVR